MGWVIRQVTDDRLFTMDAWYSKDEEGWMVFPIGEEFHWHGSRDEPFDPINNLDHAFMGVDKMIEEDDFFLEYWRDAEWLASNTLLPSRNKGYAGEITVCHTNRNEAILLWCLRAKGVVE